MDRQTILNEINRRKNNSSSFSTSQIEEELEKRKIKTEENSRTPMSYMVDDIDIAPSNERSRAVQEYLGSKEFGRLALEITGAVAGVLYKTGELPKSKEDLVELVHEERLEKARQILIDQRSKDLGGYSDAGELYEPSQKEVEELARNLLHREKLFEKRQQKGSDYIDGLDDEYFSDDKANRDRAKTFLAGTLIESEAGKDLDQRIDRLTMLSDNFDLDPDVQKLNVIMDKYEEYDNTEQVMFNMSDKDREELNELQKRVSGKIHDIDTARNDIIGRADFLQEVPEQLELARKSYAQASGFADKLFNVGLPQTLYGIGGALGRITSDIDMLIYAQNTGREDN